MNGLQIFKNNNFGEIRTIKEGDKVLFCGRDVARALGYVNPSRDVIRHCKYIEKRCATDTVGRQQEISFIPESDLYRLIVKSELPSSEQFEKWVFNEVLPSIRKTGSYIKPMTQAEIIAHSANLLVKMERKVTETSEKLDKALDVFSAPIEEDWKHSINSAINKMVIDCQLNYQVFRAKLYEELEYLAKVDLEARQRNLRNRLYNGGATKTQCRAVTKLDVISRDEKLRLIFDGIVKKYQVGSLRGA